MKKNMGSLDRIIRFIVAVIVGVLYYTGIINGTLALILGIIAIVFILTSFISFCPLYAAVGLKTTAKKEKE